MAIESAKNWLIANGYDVSDVKFDARSSESACVVEAEWWPATPGDHATFYVDAEGKVTKMVPGA